MPVPVLPPTPASSTDLLARENVKFAGEHGFSLGPPAILSTESSASSNASVKSDSSYKPSSSSSSRKRPRPEEDSEAPAELMNHGFSLPPPPTRSRRIIQMKPEGSNKTKQIGVENADKKKAANTRTPSATTAAGKKTARKTAHSIIERRRRSKMNEEFETLKSMIPACGGQQMHKLAILQAGIDYMRYLEQCVSDLQGANRSAQPPPSMLQSQAATPKAHSIEASDSEEEEEEEEEKDDMETGVPVQTGNADGQVRRELLRGYASSAASPAILPRPQTAQYVASNYSSAAPSPSFGPRSDSWSSIDRSRFPYSLSANTSPAILPQSAQDAEEASAALLMLNHDRRHSRSDRPSGLSVMDLLSH